MSGGVVLLIVNAVVAALFAACYFLIAYTQKSQRQVLPFGASYLAGMTTPLSELAIRVHANEFFMITSFAGMLAALLAMAAALAQFERRSPAWRSITLLFVVGMCGRAATWGGTETSFPTNWRTSSRWHSQRCFAR